MVAERKAQLRSVCLKTKMCKFFILGQCNRDECDYAHSHDELKSAPDLRRTKVCPTLMTTGLCTARQCPFAHDRTELRTVRLADHKQSAQPSSQAGQGSPRPRALTGKADVRSKVHTQQPLRRASLGSDQRVDLASMHLNADHASESARMEANVRSRVDTQQQLHTALLGGNQRADLMSMQMIADHASESARMKAEVRSKVDGKQQLRRAPLGSKQRADLASMHMNAESAKMEAHPVNFASSPVPMALPMKICPNKLRPEAHANACAEISSSSSVCSNESEGTVFGQNAGQVATGIGSHLLSPSPPTTSPFANAGLTDMTMALNMAMALLQGISVVDGATPSRIAPGLHPLKVAMTMA